MAAKSPRGYVTGDLEEGPKLVAAFEKANADSAILFADKKLRGARVRSSARLAGVYNVVHGRSACGCGGKTSTWTACVLEMPGSWRPITRP